MLDGGPEPWLSLTDAAHLLGVHYMTVYRWVRTGRLGGHKVGPEWRVDAEEVAALGAPSPEPAGSGGRGPDGEGRRGRRRVDHVARLLERLVSGDEGGAWSVIHAATGAGLAADRVGPDLVAPAMAAVGDRWARGDLTVGQEHLATTTATRLLGRVGARLDPPPPSRGTVVVGAPAGDHHLLPITIAADALRGRGFAVVTLGADTPVASFAEAAASASDLVAVGIGVTAPGTGTTVAATVRAIGRASGASVVVGGGGLEDAAARRAAAQGVPVVRTRTLDDLLAAVDDLAAAAHQA